jgi:hypothetical protein
MFVSLEEFFNNYRIKNGKQPNETVLNRGIMRLKREVRELESVFNIILGNDLPEWNVETYYEVDEYVQTGGAFYKSLVPQNLAVEPGVTTDWELSWELIQIDFEDIRNLLPQKADVADTLAGYGITDAYNRTEVDQFVSDLIGPEADYQSISELALFHDSLIFAKPNIVEVPPTPFGSIGDKKGDYAIDEDWMYICFLDFLDNTFPIWKRFPLPSESENTTWDFTE